MEKRVKSLAILHCFDENTSVELFKFLSSHGLSIFLMPINESNAAQAVTTIRQHSFGLDSFGIFLSYNCNSAEEVVASVSKTFFFFNINSY